MNTSTPKHQPRSITLNHTKSHQIKKMIQIFFQKIFSKDFFKNFSKTLKTLANTIFQPLLNKFSKISPKHFSKKIFKPQTLENSHFQKILKKILKNYLTL